MKNLQITPTMFPGMLTVTYIDIKGKTIRKDFTGTPNEVKERILLTELKKECNILYNKRVHAYKYGLVPRYKIKALDTLSHSINRLEGFKLDQFESFVSYISKVVQPALEVLKPGQQSRFYDSYDKQLKDIELIIEPYLPETADLLF